jgi:hypothetical protein
MNLKEIQAQFPFLSVVTYGNDELVGIIANQDQHVTAMYVVTLLKTDNERATLLELGAVWWWESNRLIPINIFLRSDMVPFKYALLTLNTKDVRVTVGPCTTLNNLAAKRVKRKSIQLVRRIP